jgi:hypothetical protein
MTKARIAFLVFVGFLAGVAFAVSCGDRHKSALAGPATYPRVHIDIYNSIPGGPDIGGTGDFPFRWFPESGAPILDLPFTIPKDWNNSSALTFYILWGGAPGSTGDVKWELRYARFAVGAGMNTLPFATINSIGTFSSDAIIRSEFTIAPTGPAGNLAPGESIILRLYRPYADSADTSTDPARLLAAGVDYTAQ